MNKQVTEFEKILTKHIFEKTNMYPEYKWMRCEQTERYMNGK